MSKLTIIPVALLFILITAFSFQPTNQNQWKKFQSLNGVNFYQKKIVKETSNYKHAYILFKYENTTNQSVSLNWKLNTWYNDKCRSCALPSPNEYEMTLNLQAGEVITGKVDNKDKMLRLFFKDLRNSSTQQLTKIELKNLN